MAFGVARCVPRLVIKLRRPPSSFRIAPARIRVTEPAGYLIALRKRISITTQRQVGPPFFCDAISRSPSFFAASAHATVRGGERRGSEGEIPDEQTGGRGTREGRRRKAGEGRFIEAGDDARYSAVFFSILGRASRGSISDSSIVTRESSSLKNDP